MKIIRKYRTESEDFIRQYMQESNSEPLDEEALSAQASASLRRAIAQSAADKNKTADKQKQAQFEAFAQQANAIACMQNLDFLSKIENALGTILFSGDCLFFDDEVTLREHREWFSRMVQSADAIWFSAANPDGMLLQLDFELSPKEEP